MKNELHGEEPKTSATDTAYAHSTSEASAGTSGGQGQSYYQPSLDADISKRMQTLRQKSPKELTAFDLTFLFASQFPLRRIHGTLHSFNGKHYYPLDRQTLEAKIIEVLFDILDKKGGIHAIKSIVYIIERMPMRDYEESSDWVGFANGVLNIKSWVFCEYSQLRMSVRSSRNPDFPQPIISPQTPPEPPIITYNLCVSYDWTRSTQWMDTPCADDFFSKITGKDQNLIARIYEMIGYLLVPDTAAKTFFLFQGVPNSGKSILGRFLEGFFLLNVLLH